MTDLDEFIRSVARIIDSLLMLLAMAMIVGIVWMICQDLRWTKSVGFWHDRGDAVIIKKMQWECSKTKFITDQNRTECVEYRRL